MAFDRVTFRWLALGLVVLVSAACGDDDDGGDATDPDSGTEDGGRVNDGGMSGRGGSGGMGGRGGTGGQSSGRQDGGQDSGPPDPCDDVEDACENEGLRCRGNDLVECAENDDGCLVETVTDCTEGDDTNYCDSEASPAECAFDPCLGLDNSCDDEGTECDDDEITLVTCAENEDGCLVETETDCTEDGDNNSCATGSGGASCVNDECKTDDGEDKAMVCVVDETMCAADILVNCVDDADGCPIATRTDCATATGCTGGACNDCDPGDNDTAPACRHDPCEVVANPCLTAGVTCKGRAVATCALDSNQCLVETLVMCGDGLTCEDEGGTPACMTCAHDPACTSVANGSKICNTVDDAVATCMDTDGDGCRELLTEPCGDNFTCDATALACVYDGEDTCTVQATLRESGSYGPYMTMDAGNDYNGYQCPGLVFPFAAAAPDLLFAVDIAPDTAIQLTLTGVTGFTGNGAWMSLLTQCGATAEADCEALGNRVIRYSNDGETTARVYVTVDADNPQNGTNQGTFGLMLDTHAIVCGDGKLDAGETCDDGNPRVGDGCTPTCTLEEGFVCTDASPSVCTTRPEEPVCANVECASLPGGSLGEVCCTAEQTCGVALGLIYGNACIERDQPGIEDEACPDETGFFGLSMIQGCCRPDNVCGLLSTSGGGCMERTAVWLNMEDGYGEFLYDGPFEEIGCTFPD